jgi:TRAP transporter TAXI family solute receptor
MKSHLAMRRVAVMLGGLCLVLGLWYMAVRPAYLRIAVGPPGSTAFAYTEGIARMLADTRQPFRLTLVPVEGSAAASELLDRGRVDLAMLRSDVSSLRADGDGPRDARSIVIVHKRAVIFAVKKASKIETPRDMAGKRIAIVNVERDSYRPMVERILAHYDLDPAKVHLTELTRAELVKAMAADELDGFILVANPASKPTRGVVSELTGAHGIELIVRGVPAHEALALRFRELITIEIPVGIFGGSPLQPAEDDTDSVGLTLEMTATAQMSEQAATGLTKALMEIRGRLRSGQDNTYAIETPPVDEERRFLPHTGTAAFVNSEAKTWLETYSDHIWLALFSVGIVGSSVAGLLSWAGLKHDAPAEALAERMRSLAARLEGAESVADVDGIQGDFDDLVLEIMREYGLRGLVEEGTPDPSPWLTTFSGLIARRRALLADLAAPGAAPSHRTASHSQIREVV